jgi:hypothetical protein
MILRTSTRQFVLVCRQHRFLDPVPFGKPSLALLELSFSVEKDS